MQADYIGFTLSSDGVSFEDRPEDWQITRRPKFGIQLCLTWGSLRRPYSLDRNPWSEGADVVLRIPFIACPWFHIWYWRKGQDHPARLYAGCKIFRAYDPKRVRGAWRDDKKDPPGYYVTPSLSFRDGDNDR